MKTGRKPMIDQPMQQTIRESIIAMVKRGASQASAAAYCGIHERTIEKWVQWGGPDIDIPGAPPYEDREPYRQFVSELTLARNAREARWVQPIDLAALRGNIHAAMWLLRTKFPEQYGDKIALEIQNSINHVLDVAERVLERSQFEKLCTALSSEGRRQALASAEEGPGGSTGTDGPTGSVH